MRTSITTLGPTNQRALAACVLFGFLSVFNARHLVAQSVLPKKDIPAIAKAADGAIVSIVMSDKEGKPIAQGSGFLVREDGLVITNYHVIAEGSSAVVKLPDGAFYLVDGVLASNKTRDIAVIKAHGRNFRTLTLGNSDHVVVGEEVVAIGNPLSLESSVSNGIVSGIRTAEDMGGNFLQITSPISPGSSGGPLFNMAGEVVGVTTLRLKGGENLNFAIPINDAKRLLPANSSGDQGLPNESERQTEIEGAHPQVAAQSVRSLLHEAKVNILYCRQNPTGSVITNGGQTKSCSGELAYLRAFCALNPASELCTLPDGAVAMQKDFQKQFDDLAEKYKYDPRRNKHDCQMYYDSLFETLRKRACMSFPEMKWPVRDGTYLSCP